MPYIVPQALVKQEFNLLPSAITEPLRAFICGPNYKLLKYTEANKPNIKLTSATNTTGQYTETAEQVFSWPSRPAGAIVDQSYARLYIDNALLRYYRNSVHEASATLEASAPNKIITDGAAFDAGVYPFSRPVSPGDVVHVFAEVDGTVYHKWTYVTKLEPAAVAASTAEPVADIDNRGAADVTGAVEKVTEGCTGAFSSQTIDIIDNTTTPYTGVADGYPEEQYSVVITAGGTYQAGASLTYNVISKSGTDNVYGVTVNYGSAGPVGTRGPMITPGDATYAVGDTFTFTAKQTYKAVIPKLKSLSTAYSGARNTTYIIEVIEGQEDAGSGGKLLVRTTNGYDGSGIEIPVVAGNFSTTAQAANATKIDIGNYGVSIYLDTGASTSTALVKGDRWTIDCVAATTGDNTTMVLAHNLPTELVSGAPALTVELFMKKNVEIARKAADGVTDNWTTTATEITIKPGLVAFDPLVVDANDVMLEMPIMKHGTDTSTGLMYMHYRALLQTKANTVNTYDGSTTVSDDLGDIDPDNPLALAVFLAYANSNGTEVKYMAVPTDDLAGYEAVLDKLFDHTDVYGIVPLSKDHAIQVAVAGHVDAMSTPERGRWRVCFLNSEAETETGVVGAAVDGDPEADATFTAETATGGNILMTWTNPPTGKGFVANGVAAGDVVRTNYELDGTYSNEFVVDSVLSETTLRLMAGPKVAINTAQKFEIWHTNDKNEVAQAYATKSGSFGSRRVYHVWPDQIEYGADMISGTFLCSAIAGLISGVVPQQGLTNLAITGFTAVSRTTAFFNTAQLNTMAYAGTFIVTQDPITGTIYTRHQVSTADYDDINARELSVVKNVDSISYVFLRQLAPYIGISNITPQLLDKLYAEIQATISYLQSNSYVPRLGGQLIDAEIVELRQHLTLEDHITCVLNLTIPYPLNNIELHLVV